MSRRTIISLASIRYHRHRSICRLFQLTPPHIEEVGVARAGVYHGGVHRVGCIAVGSRTPGESAVGVGGRFRRSCSRPEPMEPYGSPRLADTTPTPPCY